MLMPRVTVNGASERLDESPETLGQLLEQLERRFHTRGEVMTAVRCDGIDQPAFREASFWRRPFVGLELVEVEAVKPRELLLSALDEAADAIDPLERAARRLAIGFRTYNVDSANRELTEFAQSLAMLVTLTNTVATAVSADLARAGADSSSSLSLIDELTLQSATLIAAREAEDWIRLADTIEYEIEATLRRWPDALASLRDSVSSFFLSN